MQKTAGVANVRLENAERYHAIMQTGRTVAVEAKCKNKTQEKQNYKTNHL